MFSQWRRFLLLFHSLAFLTNSCVGMNGLNGSTKICIVSSDVHRSIKVWSTARLLMFHTFCSLTFMYTVKGLEKPCGCEGSLQKGDTHRSTSRIRFNTSCTQVQQPHRTPKTVRHTCTVRHRYKSGN